MKLANLARVIALAVGCAAAIGSASSTSSSPPASSTLDSEGGISGNSPPPPQQMEPSRALGLWKSSFGAVKIEPDSSKGGLQSGAVQGVWMYQRDGHDVVGYFTGALSGNVLKFHWQEPSSAAPLIGQGFLVFDTAGRQYSGRWWSDKHDRVGDWNGWRNGSGPQRNPDPYGGQGGEQYGEQGGGYPPPQGGGYPQQQGGYPPPQGGGYPQQQGGYPQQYPQGGYPQQYPQGGYPPPAQQQGGYPPPAQQQQGGYPPPQQQPYYPPQRGPQQPQQPPQQAPSNNGPAASSYY